MTIDFYDDVSFQKPEAYNYNTKLKHSQKLQGFLIEVLTEKLEKKIFKSTGTSVFAQKNMHSPVRNLICIFHKNTVTMFCRATPSVYTTCRFEALSFLRY